MSRTYSTSSSAISASANDGLFHVKHRIRLLSPGDETALEGFLAHHPDSSMFLRSNLRRSGLTERDAPYHGTYIAAFEADAIVGAVAHFWNGMLVVQAPSHVELLAPQAVAASGRKLVGLSGPGDQVKRARIALGLAGAATTEDSTDDLFALDLAALRLPAALKEGGFAVRPPAETELALLTEWSVSFNCEALGFTDGDALRRYCAELIGRLQAEKAHFVLAAAGVPVAYAAFNGTLPDMVQLGGVWTPPALRGKGYARRIVAGALLAARAEGVERAVLFTEWNNHAAQSAYRSLGFERIGDYGIVIFR
jgi:ribosomal protein S18 acetylase RimI-like enzyme